MLSSSIISQPTLVSSSAGCRIAFCAPISVLMIVATIGRPSAA
jgi:hypothetical protein